MAVRYLKDVAFRSPPVEDTEEDEELFDPGPGQERARGDDPDEGDRRKGPDREAAARRVEERRKRSEADTKEREDLRRRADEGDRFRQAAEPRLKIVDGLARVFGPDQTTQQGNDIPAPPDPYDPDYQRKHADWFRNALATQTPLIAEAATNRFNQQRQQEQYRQREEARTQANDRLVETFFDTEERADWPQEKRNHLLGFAAGRVHPTGANGSFTQQDLQDAELLLFKDEVLARAEGAGTRKIMDHLGAPKNRPRTRPGKNLSPQQVDARAEDFHEAISNMSRGRQVLELDRLQREEPQVYNHYVKVTLSAADDFDAENG